MDQTAAEHSEHSEHSECAASGQDTAALRKARGAFYTPAAIAWFVAGWAVRDAADRVLEPSSGDAAFLSAAVERLRALGAAGAPVVEGVEIHAPTAQACRERVAAAGGEASIRVGDFFDTAPGPAYDAVIGNPPYIRYQDFAGTARTRARRAALRSGVALSGLASSWAAFTVHAAGFLRTGGRLGLVLPAELLSVNYAGPVRRFVFDAFAHVELVLFEQQVFGDAETDTVLLLASGYGQGSADGATFRLARDADALAQLGAGRRWTPPDPSGKWTASLVDSGAADALRGLPGAGTFSALEEWGDTTLGIVTGNNAFFALSPQRAAELGLARRDLVRISPPGSAHLRGLALSPGMLTRLGREGRSTYLFRPGDRPSDAASAYIESGRRAGVDRAYKCRVRGSWYRVPLTEPADLLLTCMNADTPRLTTNSAGVRHLNSVHGVYLRAEYRELGRELLPLASVNSATLLSAEMVGRSYGGGILKLEPKEADAWLVPSAGLVAERAEALRGVKDAVARKLRAGKLLDAAGMVDHALFAEDATMPDDAIARLRRARAELQRRRSVRGASGR